MVSHFSDYCCSSLENTLAIEMRKHFIEAATERCSWNLGLTAIIKIIENFCKGVKFSKIIEMNTIVCALQGFSSQL